MFAADAVRLYEASADHCIGAELFSAIHAVLQDRLLRGDCAAVAGVSTIVATLRDVLHSTVLLVSQYQASLNAELPLSSAYSSLLSTYGKCYNTNSADAGPVSLPRLLFVLLVLCSLFCCWFEFLTRL